MAKIIILTIDQKKTWEVFLNSHPEANFLHSFNWGQFHQTLGKKIVRIGFYQDNKLLGVMLGILEEAKRATYLTVPGGPLIDWGNKALIKAFGETVSKTAREYNCSFVRVRPQILENEHNSKIFTGLGFVNAPMHLHAELTHQLDLSKSEDELMAAMRKSTRYEIRQAESMGIKISQTQNPQDIEKFYNLQKETAKRQGFVPFEKDFLKEQFKVFIADNQAILYSAFLKNKLLAQALIIFYGVEADYHYGASTLDGRKYPGAYLIQWQAIKEAKKRGLKRYNLWGVAPEGQKDHRFFGVSIFKRGFGGEDLEYLHARDLVLNPVAYKINWAIEMLRKKGRRV